MAKLRISLTPVLKKLEIFTKKSVTNLFLGSYKSVFKGKGIEFEGYRMHLPFDDVSIIDWKASLRANQMLVKVFGEERRLDVFLLINVSSTMFYGSTFKLKNEYAAELAASLCYAILQADDGIGFALFSDKIVQSSFPAQDHKQFYLLLRALTNEKNYGGSYNFENAIKFSLHNLKRSSILIIISDFIGLQKDWEKMLRIAAERLDVVGIMVRDPRDRTLPELKRMVLLEDTLSGKQLLIQPELISEDYKIYVAQQEKRIRDVFRSARAGFISLSTDKDFSKPMREFFMRRLKQFV